ncbi:MAG: site-specific DNA-methyltransferase [Nanoarchaeota archaeon]
MGNNLQKDLNKIICGDAIEELKKIPDESIDLVLTDPPYNCGKSNFKIQEKSYKRINQSWDTMNKEEYKKLIINTFLECKRVLKYGGTVLTTGMFHNAFDTHVWLRDDVRLNFRNFITWFKPNAMPIKFAYMIGLYAYSCEYINYFTKGKTKTFNYKLAKELNKGLQQRDLLVYKVYTDIKSGHPSQKPLSLWSYLIKIHSNKGDMILDPFLGSGTTAVAAKMLGRNYIGIEKSEEYCKIAEQRLSQQTLF